MNFFARFSLFLCISIELVSSDPQAIFLNQYSSQSAANNVGVEAGGNLYLASNDDVANLLKIRITTGTSSFTLDQLMNGQSVKMQTAQLTIQSSIDQATAATLTGFLYVTTAVQANDNKFTVTVVNGPQAINRVDDKSTTVILNVGFKTTHFPPFDAPLRTTWVTDVNQFGGTPLNFHHGLPGVNYTFETSNQFFENPQFYDNYDDNFNYYQTKMFFDSVEPIQVNLPYWYITAQGAYRLNLDSTYNNLHNRTTSSVNTTGAFVLTDVWQDHYVTFVTDPTRAGTTTSLVSTKLQHSAMVTFTGYESTSSQTYAAGNDLVHAMIRTPMVSTSLLINGTDIYPGTLFLQYAVFTGDLLPSTKSPPSTTTTTTTTTTVATTTKSAQNVNAFFAILIFVCTFLRG